MIFAVVLVNAIIGFAQESKALQAIDSLARTLVTEATVIRDGRRRRIPAADLVPGDVVALSAGDKVPADLRLVHARDLHVDESALTGESVPVAKQAVERLPEDTGLPDRVDMVHASTAVTYGQAVGVVCATGDATEVGRISELIAGVEELDTPLTKKIRSFSHLLLTAILALAAGLFVLGIARGESAFTMFMTAVALIVGAIPEGLPAAMTIMLALGVSRMARRRAIIRKLPAVETLGSTTIICSDKTGTLTRNEMTVLRIVTLDDAVDVEGSGYAPRGALTRGRTPFDPTEDAAVGDCLRAGILCNDSRLVEREGHWGIEGDPTEGALLVAGAKAGLERDALEAQLPRLDAIPFESDRQYMATLHASDGGTVAFLKGSVEAVGARCGDRLRADGTRVPFERAAVEEAADALATDGLRVLAFARVAFDDGRRTLGHEDVAEGLTFLGLQAMIDPPREEARLAIEKCHRAGIAVKMITGDHAITASAIAARLGLGATRQRSVAMTGREIDALPEADLERAADEISVFARVTPEMKLRLVRALQSRGHVVSMTGDGVNDAPALKQADIGVAMGLSGTDVARDAADMVLTDDDFASIEAAVEEGRTVFDNLTKFIVWTLPTNLGEALLILASVLFATRLPVLPVQILWINMGTAVLLGLTLAFEPKEPDVMDRPPRVLDEPILSRDLLMRTLLVGVLMLAASMSLFELQLAWGAEEALARTVTVNTIVVIEAFYLLNCRSLVKPLQRIGLWTNPWVYAGIATMLALQLVLTYVPVMNLLFHTAPMPLSAWPPVIAAGALVFLVVSVEKRIRYRWGDG